MVDDILRKKTDQEIEDEIRVKAFNHFYRMNEDEHNLYARFAMSIVESSKEFKNLKLVNQWKIDVRKRERERENKAQLKVLTGRI